MIKKINSDLANDLGNLLSRTAAMSVKYFGGNLPEPGEVEEADRELMALAQETPKKVEEKMDAVDLAGALEEIWKLVSRANKYIDETEPWKLGKDETKTKRLARVLSNLLESLRYIGILVGPFMPESGREILDELEVPQENRTWESLEEFSDFPGNNLKRHEALFPRIETEEKKEKTEEKQEQKDDYITIDDFSKVVLKSGKITGAKAHPKADKLLVLDIDMGDHTRQVVSGIRAHYEPQDLIGRQVIVCTNLKPRKLRGLKSEGMILAVEDEGKLSLLTPDKDIAPGSRVS